MIPVQGKNARALLAQKLAPRSFVKTKLSFKLVPGMAPRQKTWQAVPAHQPHSDLLATCAAQAPNTEVPGLRASSLL